MLKNHADIDEAASHMHGRLSTRTCHALLERHLAADEVVQLIAQGNFRGHLGLLALTDRAALFAQDPRSAGAPEVFALKEITSAEWARHGSTGTVTVRAGQLSAQLRRVPLGDGKAIVEALQALRSGDEVVA